MVIVVFSVLMWFSWSWVKQVLGQDVEGIDHMGNIYLYTLIVM